MEIIIFITKVKLIMKKVVLILLIQLIQIIQLTIHQVDISGLEDFIKAKEKMVD